MNHNNNVYFNNESHINNINFDHNISISHNNNPLIVFSNNYNYTQKLNNITLKQDYYYNLQYVNPEYINLLPNTEIDISSNASSYLINNNSVNDNTFTLVQGSYTFTNIPFAHPLAILNTNDITIDTVNSSYNNESTKSISATTTNNIDLTGNYNFYINDIQFKFNNEFTEDVSIYCSNHGFMGGQNLFRYKKTDYIDLNENSTSESPINVSVSNSIYFFDNNSVENNKFYFKTNLNYWWQIPQGHTLGFPTNNIDLLQGGVVYAVGHSYYDSNYTYYSGKILIKFKDINSNSLTLDDISVKCSHHGYMGGHNVLRYKTFRHWCT